MRIYGGGQCLASMSAFFHTFASWRCPPSILTSRSPFSLLRSEVLLPFQISLVSKPGKNTPAESWAGILATLHVDPISAVRLLRVSLCETWTAKKKTLTKTQGSRDWLGTTRSKKGIVSICLNYFWHSDTLRKLVLILDGSSSLLRPFWTFAAAKSQKAGHLGVLQVQGIGWVACRCDKLMTCSKWLQYNHPQNGVRICSTTQAKPACGPRVDSIFERSLMECHEAGPAASKLGEGQISTGCPLLPFLDIMNLACEDINEDLSLQS